MKHRLCLFLFKVIMFVGIAGAVEQTKLFKGFSLSINSFQKKNTLRIADLTNDGFTNRKIIIPGGYPFMNIVFETRANHYTEELNFSMWVNRSRFLNATMPGMYRDK